MADHKQVIVLATFLPETVYFYTHPEERVKNRKWVVHGLPLDLDLISILEDVRKRVQEVGVAQMTSTGETSPSSHCKAYIFSITRSLSENMWTSRQANILGAKSSDIAPNIAICFKNVFSVGKNTSPSVIDKTQNLGVQTGKGTMLSATDKANTDSHTWKGKSYL